MTALSADRIREIEALLTVNRPVASMPWAECAAIRDLLAELRRRERMEDAVIEELRAVAHFDQSMEMAGALNRCRRYLGGDLEPPA